MINQAISKEILYKLSQIIILISDNLEDTVESNEKQQNTADIPEMISIKEAVATISGLSEFTIRKYISTGKLPHIRAGEGKNGKILINKTDLINILK